MGRRAGVYCRISDDKRGLAAGVGRQETDGLALCERLGWEVVEVYVDNDVSAYSGRKRPAYERLLTDLRAGRIDAVAAYHPDRLHRRPVELERFIDVVEATRAKVATAVAGDYDLSTASGRMVARILGATARAESERIGEKVRRANDDRAAQGLVHGGGLRPFGYEADGVTVNPAERDVARWMAAQALCGASSRAIALGLQERNVSTPRGARWTGKAVRRFLTSARIAGLRVHRGDVLGPASWPGLVDRATWEALCAALADPSRTNPRRERRYLLSGILRCGKCGARLVARETGDQRHATSARYQCRARGDGGCGGTAVSIAIDDFVRRVVLDRWDELEATPPPEPDDDRTGVEARMVELAEMWAAGEIARAEYLAARQALERQLAPAPTVAPLRRALGANPRAAWPTMPLAQRRAVVETLVERIEVGPVVVPGWNQFDPRRVMEPHGRIVWRV